MAKLNTNTVVPVGVLAGSATQLGQINVPKLGGMLIAVPAPGSIGPAGPASTVPGPQGPPGPMGPKGIDGAGALTTDALGSLVHSANPVTTVVDADEFTVADSADSFKAKRFSWASLKAAILAWFGPVTATLSNKNLSAASNVFPTSLVTLTGAQSLSHKTLVTPTITGPTINPVTAGPNAVALTVGGSQVRANGNNVALGQNAQYSLTTGGSNLALGAGAQYLLTTGSNNLALGVGAQQSLTKGNSNIALGYTAQYVLTTGSNNFALGYATQKSLTTGGSNVALGVGAQQLLTTGSNNVALGNGAQHQPLGAPSYPTTTALNQTSVGFESGQNTATQIDGITTIGYHATAGAVNGTSLGIRSRADHTDSVALGSNTHTTAANQVAVGPRDVEITDATKGLVLKSPDGSRFRISVENAGVLSAAKI